MSHKVSFYSMSDSDWTKFQEDKSNPNCVFAACHNIAEDENTAPYNVVIGDEMICIPNGMCVVVKNLYIDKK